MTPDDLTVRYTVRELLERIDSRLTGIEARLDDLEGWRARVIGMAVGAGACAGGGVFAVLRAVVGG